MTVRCPAELREHYMHGRLIPFIGAGVSMAVSWIKDGTEKRGPSWKELVDEAIRKLDFSDPELLRMRGTDLQILEYFNTKRYGFTPLTNWLYSEMRPPDDALRSSRLHKALADLKRCHIFYTTNYDDFIERSFRLHGRACRAVAKEADMGYGSARGDECEIVKFHGDWDHPDGMVLSESHYEARLSLQTEMDYRLRADLLGRALLFIGYSFRDWNVAYLFRLMNETFRSLPGSASGRRAYIAVPDPSDFEIRLFRQRNMEVIPVRGSMLTEDIAQLLNELGA